MFPHFLIYSSFCEPRSNYKTNVVKGIITAMAAVAQNDRNKSQQEMKDFVVAYKASASHDDKPKPKAKGRASGGGGGGGGGAAAFEEEDEEEAKADTQEFAEMLVQSKAATEEAEKFRVAAAKRQDERIKQEKEDKAALKKLEKAAMEKKAQKEKQHLARSGQTRSQKDEEEARVLRLYQKRKREEDETRHGGGGGEGRGRFEAAPQQTLKEFVETLSVEFQNFLVGKKFLAPSWTKPGKAPRALSEEEITEYELNAKQLMTLIGHGVCLEEEEEEVRLKKIRRPRGLDLKSRSPPFPPPPRPFVSSPPTVPIPLAGLCFFVFGFSLCSVFGFSLCSRLLCSLSPPLFFRSEIAL